jgi:hypothetical protein
MPASPSLLIVPARFKTGKLYTQIATTSAGVVLGSSGDFNVTRATTATRFNSAGLIESVASGVPRLDYYTSGGTAGCPALLVEPSAQNLAWHSHLWVSGTNWANNEVSVVTGTTATTDPFGTNLANAISPTSGNAFHIAQSNNPTAIAFTSGTIYTQSAFFKQGTGVAGRYAQLTFSSTAFSQLGYANFDLQLGTLAVVSGTSADTNRAASIENFGNGWYRCRLAGTCTSSTSAAGVGFVLATTSGFLRAGSFSGTVTDVIYGFGAQLETGSVATSYIPTTAAPVTRNADVISVTGAVSGCIGQTEGTIYAEVDMRNAISRNANFLQLRQDGSNFITIGITTAFGGTNTIAVRAQQAGSFVIGFHQQNNAAGIYKIAFAYKSTDCKLYINGTDAGVTIVTNNAFTAFSFNEIQLGMSNSANHFNDRIRSAALYSTRLTDSELAALTTL